MLKIILIIVVIVIIAEYDFKLFLNTRIIFLSLAFSLLLKLNLEEKNDLCSYIKYP